MKIQEIISLLKEVRKNGAGYTALCPAHNDQRRSLSINETNGRILIKCFAGCNVNTIVSVPGIESKDLFTELKQGKSASNFQSKKIIAVYDYVDETGEILYQNVRYEPKDFRQRKPNGAGGYDYSLNGTRRVPYRLPELIEAVERSADVWLCEGEKDADNLRNLGLAATSFKNWKSEFNQYLKSAHVCLIQDHDKAGLKQANYTLKLLSGNVASLKTLDFFAGEPLPEKHGKDFTDWLESQKQDDLGAEEIAERLCILIDNANLWQQTDETEEDTEGAQDFTSLFTIQEANVWIEGAKLRPVPKMLFGELWFEGELCIKFSDTGKGKSILAVQIADAISRGESVPNFKLEAGKQTVLYFDFELSDKQFEARYSTKEGDYFTNHYTFDKNFKRGEINQNSFMPKGFKNFEDYLNFSLEHEIAETNAKVLIVDNITYLKSATETAKDALPLMKELIRLKRNLTFRFWH